ncbi:hypothetical protein QN277_024405 [Acacia crassicarpa]|uniref:Uncharacterized protein n=1 Tax=Acacia crassicarpa TaxID=499986 RepID=A0AAE1MHA7_9FABA|nr:hypothetical protein QN277_024405 [Acacia crassicarpa]
MRKFFAATIDKTKSNTLKGFRTFLVVGFIAFPILVIVTLINHNSIPLLVEESSKTNVLGERAQIANVSKEGEDVSLTVTPQAMGVKGQNVTGSEPRIIFWKKRLMMFYRPQKKASPKRQPQMLIRRIK